MKTTREYIDKYQGLLVFFPFIVPIVFIGKIWIRVGGYLLDKLDLD